MPLPTTSAMIEELQKILKPRTYRGNIDSLEKAEKYVRKIIAKLKCRGLTIKELDHEFAFNHKKYWIEGLYTKKYKIHELGTLTVTIEWGVHSLSAEVQVDFELTRD